MLAASSSEAYSVWCSHLEICYYHFWTPTVLLLFASPCWLGCYCCLVWHFGKCLWWKMELTETASPTKPLGAPCDLYYYILLSTVHKQQYFLELLGSNFPNVWENSVLVANITAKAQSGDTCTRTLLMSFFGPFAAK